MARPQKYKVDTAKLEYMASIGCTYEEIANVLEVPENVLKKSYSLFYTKGRQNLKERLRKKQIEIAESGNVVMLIWLGKQYLDQKDREEHSIDEATYEFLIGTKKKDNQDS